MTVLMLERHQIIIRRVSDGKLRIEIKDYAGRVLDFAYTNEIQLPPPNSPTPGKG